MSEIPIFIPSKGRAGMVTTHKHFWPVQLCIAESEKDAYAAAHPEIPIVTHPDSIVGLKAKWNWMYAELGSFFSIDDDAGALIWLGMGPGEPQTKYSKEIAYEIVQATADVAKQMGSYLFSFGRHSDPRNFRPQNPMGLSGAMSLQGCFGWLAGSKLYFPDDPYFPFGDYFISALNAYHHRFLFRDDRYAILHTQKTFQGTGGGSFFRNSYHMERGAKEMMRLFGDSVQMKTKNVDQRGQRSHRWEINLTVPW